MAPAAAGLALERGAPAGANFLGRAQVARDTMALTKTIGLAPASICHRARVCARLEPATRAAKVGPGGQAERESESRQR